MVAAAETARKHTIVASAITAGNRPIVARKHTIVAPAMTAGNHAIVAPAMTAVNHAIVAMPTTDHQAAPAARSVQSNSLLLIL